MLSCWVDGFGVRIRLESLEFRALDLGQGTWDSLTPESVFRPTGLLVQDLVQNLV